VPTDERTGPRFPLLLDHGPHPAASTTSARRPGALPTVVWHEGGPSWKSTRTDAENRGVKYGRLGPPRQPLAAETTLRATVTDRVAPGVVYTTFHHPDDAGQRRHHGEQRLGNQLPKYKVTAVQVAASNGPSDWQRDYAAKSRQARRDRGRRNRARKAPAHLVTHGQPDRSGPWSAATRWLSKPPPSISARYWDPRMRANHWRRDQSACPILLGPP